MSDRHRAHALPKGMARRVPAEHRRPPIGNFNPHVARERLRPAQDPR